MLNQDLLEDERESVMLMSQDLDANKLDKNAESAKKHMSEKKSAAVNMDMKGMIKILNNFYPNLQFTNLEEVMESVEFTFLLKLKHFSV